MSTINYTYNVIVDRFRQFAAGHFQLRRFTHGEISQADLEKEAEWPWLHVKPRAINYSPGTRSFSFEIFISDLPRDKEDKTGYQAESITDCSLIFQDLINEIYLGNMFGSDVVLTRPVNAEPFVEQYTHTLTGVTGTIELNLDYDWSACSIPASWNYNTPTDSPSDGWGALQFIESLEQNGVFVSLLNDVEAPGNSYYYGTNASGVKGWYAIVDNVGLTCETLPDCATIISIVDDIAALQTDVALKANTADLGATAFSNDYNDLDNLPTIPAQYNPTAGTGVSITGTYPNQTITNTAPDQVVALTAGTNIGVTGTYPNFTISNTQSLAGLVPETRTLTINGTTQDLSANRTFTIATGLTVGTTPITSGTVGRVLFEGTGNVLQEDSALSWDNTNKRLNLVSTGDNLLNLTPQASGNAIVFNNNSYIKWGTIGYMRGFSTSTLFAVYNSGYTNIFNIGTSSACYVNTGSNFLIGTTTDAGYKLDVNGTARVSGDTIIQGSSALSNANGFLVRNSSAVHGLSVTNNAEVKIGRNQLFGFFDTSTGGYTFNITATNSGVSISNTAAASRPVSFSMNTGEILRIHQSYTAIVTNNFLVGTTTDVASSKLTIESTTQGFLPPRMTTTQKNAIATPAAGLVVYDTTLGKLCVRTAAAWETITSV